jgi:GTP-binding protein
MNPRSIPAGDRRADAPPGRDAAQPTIAIVGRPNVGKSTLFNRLTARRAALVSDVPGLTRDRRTGEAVIGRQAVTLIDTAGLEDAAAGSIAERMRTQTEAAIAEADLVLFVLDARAGVLPLDVQLARSVRRSGRPMVLVANKCEGRAAALGQFEAFRLGLGEPIAVSAEHGDGMGDLTAAVASALGLSPRAPPANADLATGDQACDCQPAGDLYQPLRVAIVGRPNSGKSTLLNALLGQQRMLTGPEPGLTRDAIAVDCLLYGRSVRLIDTAGLRRRSRISDPAERLAAGDAVRAMRFAEVVVLLVDAEHALEHQDLSIASQIVEEGRALVIGVNKWDLVADKQKRLRQLRSLLDERLAQVPGVEMVPLSALAGAGLDRLMGAAFRAYDVWNRRVPTPELNRWLAEALERHAPPAAHGRRVRIRFMTQPSARPPTFIAFCSRPEALPQAYLRYLSNGLREAFRLPGVPIRLKLRKGENPYAR